MASVADPGAPAAPAALASERAATPAAPRACGLDRSAWPIERLVVLMSGSVSLLALALGHRRPRWRLLNVFIATNLVMLGVVGWCPGCILRRWLGFRRAADRPGA
jgi:hypothetical protein